MLEVIEKGSGSAEHPTPLLFVHGGWHAAWCWENFLDFFADAGYRAVALSLRGHGASPTSKPLHRVSIADYLDDVAAVAGELGGAPILIGHSLGGFVIQRYLETHRVPAAVLVGSVPPQGVLRLALRVWRRRPSMTMEAWNDPTC
ncbi:Non-heme chloroperoxidase [Mycobacterium avium subsp. paratuberculosis]|nr:Non-heme chloroperoxidase [Mycobacterium avium subsp. paratuberculosis]